MESKLKTLILDTLRHVPGASRAVAWYDRYRLAHWAPPGHFYSPLPDVQQVRRNEHRLFDDVKRDVPGVDLNEPGQLELLGVLEKFYAELPFGPKPANGLRYGYDNTRFGSSDAIFLYSMLRHFRPRRVIEVGSGFSSCVTLDTNERFFENKIACTFIEPYPEVLMSLLKPGDKERIELIGSDLQAVELKRFCELEANDILFIDSTHVAKIGSDVNYIVFQILPALRPGVVIHFHDIHYPFEYPRDWIYEGRAWNEVYLLRAFLQYNGGFEILAFNTFLERYHEQRFRERMPLCLLSSGGSLWLRKR